MKWSILGMILIGVWLLRTSHAIGSRDVKSSLRQAKLPNGQVHYQYKNIIVNGNWYLAAFAWRWDKRPRPSYRAGKVTWLHSFFISISNFILATHVFLLWGFCFFWTTRKTIIIIPHLSNRSFIWKIPPSYFYSFYSINHGMLTDDWNISSVWWRLLSEFDLFQNGEYFRVMRPLFKHSYFI